MKLLSFNYKSFNHNDKLTRDREMAEFSKEMSAWRTMMVWRKKMRKTEKSYSKSSNKEQEMKQI